ncbi:hypothetical protein [Streptomyces sp. HPF1205]|uniref:Rv1733c family protein n=1 Tax=Streptomyces sp. HPF1205 TaxID=2873262 RepID=UPI001CEC5D31|nr:hypothetical protein [Streptomyces sp. HPF1205]
MGTSVRLWRWRRNPLKRGTDRIEAWALLAAGLLLAVGAPAAGVGAGLATMAHAPHPPIGWQRTSATLTRDAPPAITAGAGSRQVRAAVTWVAAVGRPHAGDALVAPGSPAGSRTTIWLDTTGALRDSPVDPERDRALAVIYGTAAATGTALIGGGGWAVAHRVLDRRRAAGLDREWAVVGPQWGRHRT